MTTAVFPIRVSYNLTHNLKFTNVVVDMGDGFEQRVNKNIGFSTYLSPATARADGEGGSGNNYRGINVFEINMKNLAHINGDATQTANKLWAFYKARYGRFEPFYFYNPAETSSPDLTGATATGRYLVRFDNDICSREQFIRNLFNSSITLVEVRQ